MHSYLRAIGFSKVKSYQELKPVISQTIKNYDEKIVFCDNNDKEFIEVSKSFCCDCGITVCGEYNEKDELDIEYYFPYFKGTGITTKESISIEKSLGRESFTGACDDIRIGVTLIFYLQNAAAYMKELDKENLPKSDVSATFSGLSIKGSVLLPLIKNEKQKNTTKEAALNRGNLIAAARLGDESAMESLTIEDLDMYSMISKRLLTDDVFTIIDSYFMPYGMECDQYSLMGDIKDYSLITNEYTNEKVYQMTIECNDMVFDVCINEEDLIGAPEVGRRFKGVIWLQGRINF